METVTIDLNEKCLIGCRPYTDDCEGETDWLGHLTDQWCLLEIAQQMAGRCWTLEEISKMVSRTTRVYEGKVQEMVKGLVAQGIVECVENSNESTSEYRFKKGAQLQIQFIVP